jgi:hypothetical protein
MREQGVEPRFPCSAADCCKNASKEKRKWNHASGTSLMSPRVDKGWLQLLISLWIAECRQSLSLQFSILFLHHWIISGYSGSFQTDGKKILHKNSSNVLCWNMSCKLSYVQTIHCKGKKHGRTRFFTEEKTLLTNRRAVPQTLCWETAALSSLQVALESTWCPWRRVGGQTLAHWMHL